MLLSFICYYVLRLGPIITIIYMYIYMQVMHFRDLHEAVFQSDTLGNANMPLEFTGKRVKQEVLNNVNSTLNQKTHTVSLSSDANKRRHFISIRCKSTASAFKSWQAWHMPTVDTVNICVAFCSLCCSGFVLSPKPANPLLQT